jgi:hypothetical protein
VRPMTWQERVWLLIAWSDGRRERIEEDYPPWSLVGEMRQGWLELETEAGAEPMTFRGELAADDHSCCWRPATGQAGTSPLRETRDAVAPARQSQHD